MTFLSYLKSRKSLGVILRRLLADGTIAAISRKLGSLK
jgi:hypothetical protein